MLEAPLAEIVRNDGERAGIQAADDLVGDLGRRTTTRLLELLIPGDRQVDQRAGAAHRFVDFRRGKQGARGCRSFTVAGPNQRVPRQRLLAKLRDGAQLLVDGALLLC